MHLARDIRAFVMYCVNGASGSSLLIESGRLYDISTKHHLLLNSTLNPGTSVLAAAPEATPPVPCPPRTTSRAPEPPLPPKLLSQHLKSPPPPELLVRAPRADSGVCSAPLCPAGRGWLLGYPQHCVQ